MAESLPNRPSRKGGVKVLQLKLTVQLPTLYGGDCHSSWENDIWRLETWGGAGQRAVPQSAGQ